MNKGSKYKLITLLLLTTVTGCFVLIMAYFKMKFPSLSLKIAVLTGTLASVIALAIRLFTSDNNTVDETDLNGSSSNSSQFTEAHAVIEKEKQEHEQEEQIKQLVQQSLKKVKAEKSSKNDYDNILIGLAKDFEIVQGQYFIFNRETELFELKGVYAYYSDEEAPSFKLGENLSGQVAKDQKPLNINHIPENYITILSGLGSSTPSNLLLVPIVKDEQTIALVELASFVSFNKKEEAIIQQVLEQSFTSKA